MRVRFAICTFFPCFLYGTLIGACGQAVPILYRNEATCARCVFLQSKSEKLDCTTISIKKPWKKHYMNQKEKKSHLTIKLVQFWSKQFGQFGHVYHSHIRPD